MATTATPRHKRDHPSERSWLADQLLEPTKLVFAVVIAQSLSEYRDVLTSPIFNRHYIATLALLGIYLTTVWSWRGWHAAHLKTPYDVQEDGGLPSSEVYRFYTDLAIVIAYAYTLFQVAPLVEEPKTDIVWLLLGYPIIVGLYIIENLFRVRSYGRGERRAVPLLVTLLAHLAVAGIYLLARRKLAGDASSDHDLLWLNGVTLTTAIIVMWGYRHYNEYYQGYIKRKASAASGGASSAPKPDAPKPGA
jgi:hypothetical protein